VEQPAEGKRQHSQNSYDRSKRAGPGVPQIEQVILIRLDRCSDKAPYQK